MKVFNSDVQNIHDTIFTHMHVYLLYSDGWWYKSCSSPIPRCRDMLQFLRPHRDTAPNIRHFVSTLDWLNLDQSETITLIGFPVLQIPNTIDKLKNVGSILDILYMRRTFCVIFSPFDKKTDTLSGQNYIVVWNFWGFVENVGRSVLCQLYGILYRI